MMPTDHNDSVIIITIVLHQRIALFIVLV